MTKPPFALCAANRALLAFFLGFLGLIGPTVRLQGTTRPAAPAVVALADQLEKTPEGRTYRTACLPTISAKLRAAPKDCSKTAKGSFVVSFVLIVSANGQVADLVVPGDPYTACIVKDFKGLALPRPPRADWPIHVTVEMKPHHEAGMPETQKERLGVFAEADRLSKTKEGHAYEVSCGPVLFKALDHASKECRPLTKQSVTVDLALLVAADGHVTGVLGKTDPVTARAAESFQSLVLPKPPHGKWSLHVTLDIRH